MTNISFSITVCQNLLIGYSLEDACTSFDLLLRSTESKKLIGAKSFITPKLGTVLNERKLRKKRNERNKDGTKLELPAGIWYAGVTVYPRH